MAKSKPKVIVTLAEQAYAKRLLQYLSTHYARSINASDPYLIYAVVAWLHAADKEFPTRLKSNNPFSLLDPKTGKLAKFKDLNAGIAGAARALIRGAKTKGNEQSLFRGALNALKSGGNAGANQFLQWLAFTSWSPRHYGWDPGEDPSNPDNNALVRWYLRLGDMQIVQKKVVKKKVVIPPQPPRDLNAPIIVRNYIDPYAVAGFYRERHPAIPILPDD